MSDTDYDVIIVGGGIAGMACGVALARRGIQRLLVCEKALALKPTGAALGLFPNGLEALKEISPTATERIKASAVPASKLQMKNLEGETIREIDMESSPRVLPTFLVWYLLQEYLKDELLEGVLSLGHAVESFSVVGDEQSNNQIVKVRTLNRFENNAPETKTCKVLIGADGIKSVVRTLLFGKRPMKYHGKMVFRAVMNLDRVDPGICPPAGTSTSYQGEEKGKLFALRETAKDILTITAMSQFEEPDLIQSAEDRKKRLQELFSGYPDTVAHVIERIPPSSLYENAVHDIEVENEWSRGPVVLIGDAAHAMTPGMGQGANQGLEDACELAIALAPTLLDSTEPSSNCSISDVLEGFWRGRIDRVREIHAASRAQSQQISSKKVDYSNQSPLEDRMYGWKPTQSGTAKDVVVDAIAG